jgi:PilZ domain
MIERRTSFRQRTYLGASISSGPKRGAMDCLVRNLSVDGALIEFDDRRVLPQHFEVKIRNRQRRFRAVMIWRQNQRAGVLFSR